MDRNDFSNALPNIDQVGNSFGNAAIGARMDAQRGLAGIALGNSPRAHSLDEIAEVAAERLGDAVRLKVTLEKLGTLLRGAPPAQPTLGANAANNSLTPSGILPSLGRTLAELGAVHAQCAVILTGIVNAISAKDHSVG